MADNTEVHGKTLMNASPERWPDVCLGMLS